MSETAIGSGDQDRVSCERRFHQSVLCVVKSPPERRPQHDVAAQRAIWTALEESDQRSAPGRRSSCAFDGVGNDCRWNWAAVVATFPSSARYELRPTCSTPTSARRV